MRKINVFFLSILFATLFANAQSQVTIVNTTFNIDSLFSQLDVGLMPHGLLIDRVDANNIDLYDGSCNDCYSNSIEFNQFLSDLKMARFGGNFYLDTWAENYQSHIEQNKVVPIQIVNIQYSKIKDSALVDSLLVINNGLIDDNANAVESPYTSHRFFACSIANEITM